MQQVTLVGGDLGLTAGDARVIAGKLLKGQLFGDKPLSPKQFVGELVTFNSGEKAEILAEFRNQGGDPLFISKVESILASSSSPAPALRSKILMGAGIGIAGLAGFIIGRVTKR